jgi:hypothetical protein
MKESVFLGVDPVQVHSIERVLLNQFYAEISPMAWDSTLKGPITSIAVAPLAGPPYCGSTAAAAPDVDKFQAWSSLAYAYELTNDPTFLAHAAQMSGAISTPNLLTAQQAMNWANHENRAGLLALAQLLWL